MIAEPRCSSWLAIEPDAAPETIAVALTRPENALVFAGYATVALVAGTILLSCGPL